MVVEHNDFCLGTVLSLPRSTRPTATELLKHPFFKKGKDKAFLKEALLSDEATLAIPSLPGRRVPGTSGRLKKADDGGWVWSDDEVAEEDESHEVRM